MTTPGARGNERDPWQSDAGEEPEAPAQRKAPAGLRKGLRDDRFAGTLVRPGDVAQVDLKVSETFTHQPARIQITVARAEKPGPTFFVTAAVHGDEINGVAIVRRILDGLESNLVAGTVIGVPVANRFGFLSQDRYLPDRRDLNRFFPGDRQGSMASRIADTLFRKVVAISDAGVDLHTAAQGFSNLCHIRADSGVPRVRELMRAFGTPITVHHPGPRGSLRRAATEAGVPTLLFEAGEPSRFQRHVIEMGSDGVLRALRKLGMVTRRFQRTGFQVLVRRSEWVRSDHGGLLDMQVDPGDLVRSKHRIASIQDPFGRQVDEILAPRGGVVLSTATIPLTNPGNAVVHVGHLHKTLARARAYVRGGGDLGHVNWISAKRRRARAKPAASGSP